MKRLAILSLLPITALALILLFWPVISKVIALVKPPKQDEFASQRGGRHHGRQCPAVQ